MRSKQYELITLRDLLAEESCRGKCVPIIEPVNITGNSHVKSFGKLNALNVPFILIINPEKGKLGSEEIRINLIDTIYEDNQIYRPAYLITNRTTVEGITEVLEENKGRELVLVHREEFILPNRLTRLLNKYSNIRMNIFMANTSVSYRELFSNGATVLIKDGFNRVGRNADYPDQSNFSNLHNTFQNQYSGFGDYLIVGDHYSERGGKASAVAIHFTHQTSENIIMTKHFVSDTTDNTKDLAGKYGEAHDKLVRFLDQNSQHNFTQGSNELYDMDEFRGLGYLKKVSMKHHIELICSLI